ncbi:MAG: helix-hairpin-helix domain-containing protein [Acidimicrobiales bacterium]
MPTVPPRDPVPGSTAPRPARPDPPPRSGSSPPDEADPGFDLPALAEPLGLTDQLDRALRTADGIRRRPRLAAAVVTAAAVTVAVGVWLGRPPPVGPVDAAIPVAASGSPGSAPPVPPSALSVPSSEPPAEPEVLTVHMAGAVHRPGVVLLQPGSRVVDAIDAAGGATPEADLDLLNLAAPVADGIQIRVPVAGETVVGPAAPGSVPTGSEPAGASGADGAPVNLNTATAAELETLPGIGPTRAEEIIRWRDEHGPFRGADQLLDVPGIGPATLERLADRITW